MADSNIQLPADGAGKKVDTRTESTNSEHREVHVIGDPATNEGVAVVTNVDPSGEIYGVVVRDPNTTTVASNTSNITTLKFGSGETNSNSLRVIQATDAISSSQTLLIARTTNPSGASDATSTFATSDKLGRHLSRPIQVRELITTAYTSISTGSETTIATAGAGTYLDLIMITATNNSSAATQLDIRAVSAGNIIHTMYLPANTGPIGFTPTVPWPQDATGNAWTADLPDITGTTVYVSALFSQEK